MGAARPGRAGAAAVAAIGLGWDTGILTQLSLNGTNSLEQALLEKIHPGARRAGGGDDDVRHAPAEREIGPMPAGGGMMMMAPKGAVRRLAGRRADAAAGRRGGVAQFRRPSRPKGCAARWC